MGADGLILLRIVLFMFRGKESEKILFPTSPLIQDSDTELISYYSEKPVDETDYLEPNGSDMNITINQSLSSRLIEVKECN